MATVSVLNLPPRIAFPVRFRQRLFGETTRIFELSENKHSDTAELSVFRPGSRDEEGPIPVFRGLPLRHRSAIGASFTESDYLYWADTKDGEPRPVNEANLRDGIVRVKVLPK